MSETNKVDISQRENTESCVQCITPVVLVASLSTTVCWRMFIRETSHHHL